MVVNHRQARKILSFVHLEPFEHYAVINHEIMGRAGCGCVIVAQEVEWVVH